MRWVNPFRVRVRDTGTATAATGGLAITGAVDTVNFGSLPLARSRYREQVRETAPTELLGRDKELAELAAFCTGPDPAASYVWWRAPAWAGKSALMSWFVLNPPAGVLVVPFFITARYAGNSDRNAFVDIVMEQLAEHLGEPMPTYLTAANRHTHLLGLLRDAAEAQEKRGKRLVLLVDGLDEDRGVTTGPDAYSIAALLPARPPAGLRVIVAGRPNPPIPDDVPQHHPLRERGVARTLSPSRHARAARTDAQRELTRLLHGTIVERDLLGLVTAAGGGLSGADLAELTGADEYEIGAHFAAVSGRPLPPATDDGGPMCVCTCSAMKNCSNRPPTSSAKPGCRPTASS